MSGRATISHIPMTRHDLYEKIRQASVAFAVVFLGLVSASVPLLAHAYTIESLSGITNANDFVLEPGKIEARGDPGETIIRTIAVTNRVNQDVHFHIESEDFVGSNYADQTVVLLGNDRSPYSFKDNLHVEKTDFTLRFGERITIPVSITIPSDAAPGGYYASLLITNAPDRATKKAVNGARTVSRLGALFFVRVNGPVNENGKLEDFRIKGPNRLFYSGGPYTFQILFNNTGTVHLVPYGYIEVNNFAGRNVADLPVNAYFAMPNALRYREVAWPAGNLVGRYTATVHLNRGYGSTTDEMSFSFWVLPWRLVLTILVPIFILAFIIYVLSRKFEFRRKR